MKRGSTPTRANSSRKSVVPILIRAGNPGVHAGRECDTILTNLRRHSGETQTVSTHHDVYDFKGYVGFWHLRESTRRAETSVLNISGRRFPRAGSAIGCGVRVGRQHGKPPNRWVKCDRPAIDHEVDARGESHPEKPGDDDSAGDRSARGSATGRFRKSGGVKPAPLTPEETVLKPARQHAGFPPVWGSPAVYGGEDVTSDRLDL